MNAINYLKFDFRIIKGNLKYYSLFFIAFAISMLYSENNINAMSYLFFVLIIVAILPFSSEGNKKSTEMYYMFPSKTSSMVMGRFLYLIILNIIVWVIEISTMIHFYNIGSIEMSEIILICFAGIIATIVCMIQYSVYYKFGMEKGRAILMLVYMVPAFFIFALPSILSERTIPNNILNLMIANKTIIGITTIITIIVVGAISYLISCYICENKDV
ncbi:MULTISPECIES: ABC-2 transporter permease [Clostridium]|uniref:ABC-2 transporter permease n=1 Tax=Clostridium aquiflavi TaxID=3073603 RepID=A0ABU1EKQ4_9CLOT|nr:MULTISPECIES: ABC-2 transporter permease [unclassified Clostridium]MDR5588951.1 ABC-2 transporter permease [Clostridium sp. 5N-1]NFG63493.1 ABC-2 transporter permease [Clostridium botulinum]NFQ08108.1 ABC-2 transporter permease [Clostridium botulinum]